MTAPAIHLPAFFTTSPCLFPDCHCFYISPKTVISLPWHGIWLKQLIIAHDKNAFPSTTKKLLHQAFTV
jgi:hypothetical protein